MYSMIILGLFCVLSINAQPEIVPEEAVLAASDYFGTIIIGKSRNKDFTETIESDVDYVPMAIHFHNSLTDIRILELRETCSDLENQQISIILTNGMNMGNYIVIHQSSYLTHLSPLYKISSRVLSLEEDRYRRYPVLPFDTNDQVLKSCVKKKLINDSN